MEEEDIMEREITSCELLSEEMNFVRRLGRSICSMGAVDDCGD
jgi:hypothetical protein